jgi:hypothetical protein
MAKQKCKKVPWNQEFFFKIRLLNDESIRWLCTQRVKFHLNNVKENETDIEKEWENLHNIIEISSIRKFKEIKRRNGRNIYKYEMTK